MSAVTVIATRHALSLVPEGWDGDWTNDLEAVAGVNNQIDFDPLLIEAAILDDAGNRSSPVFKTGSGVD